MNKKFNLKYLTDNLENINKFLKLFFWIVFFNIVATIYIGFTTEIYTLYIVINMIIGLFTLAIIKAFSITLLMTSKLSSVGNTISNAFKNMSNLNDKVED